MPFASSITQNIDRMATGNASCLAVMMNGYQNNKVSRRGFISSALLTVAFFSFGCEKKYKRIGGYNNLGEPRNLLYGMQIVRDRNMLVIRDREGWATMHAACTKDGCALSYQKKVFTCTCCNSVFTHEGEVVKGPATERLPFFKMDYKDGLLFADSSKEVSREERFTTPELEQAIAQLAERIQQEGVRPGAQIPDILMGKGDGEPGKMFVEENPPTEEE